MSPRGNNPDVIHVLVKHKIIDNGKTIEIRRGGRLQLDGRSNVDFVAIPTFDHNRAGRCSGKSYRAAVLQTRSLVTRRGALQQRTGRLFLIFLRSRRNRENEKKEKQTCK